MRRVLIAAAVACLAAVGLSTPVLAAGAGSVKLQAGEWSFAGPFGYFDKAAMQRGFQVYREVCAGCLRLLLLYHQLTQTREMLVRAPGPIAQ